MSLQTFQTLGQNACLLHILHGGERTPSPFSRDGHFGERVLLVAN